MARSRFLRARRQNAEEAASGELAGEPRAGEIPVPLERGEGNLQGGGFGFAEPAEKPEFHHVGRARIESLKAGQRLVDPQQALVDFDGGAVAFQQGDLGYVPAPFPAAHAAGMVHQNPPQLLRRHGVEMGAILPGNRFATADPQKELVHDGGGLQRVPAALAAHLPGSNAMQFTVNQRDEPVPGILISRAPTVQQHGYGVSLTRLRRVHRANYELFLNSAALSSAEGNSMTPDELSRIREIYEHSLAMISTARDAFLDRECQGQPAIREEVERLLEAHANIPTWLDRPAIGETKAFAGVELPREGRRLGAYTVMREIGRGGMAAVYLAERSDGAFVKQVAVKVVLPSLDTAGVIERFRQERAILASLDHPNIARLLDGGVTEEGWPYIVLEYVEGQPIDVWCDGRKLDVRQRIELFRSVMEAVRYAHQRLVVHRDLMPANIFVTKDGTVKLLDFGIAKILSTPKAGEAPETVTLARIMTPEYASPEQVSGAPITTLSDLYSLGVILYELLTGHRPYRLLSAALHEMARVITEEEPTRPSDVVATTEPLPGSGRDPITPAEVSAVREGDPDRLRRRLAGDLDSILLMALRKEPEHRYGSVESFADDLRRHLDHRPVTAREASAWERVRRFCRRNPGGVAAGVLLVLSLLAGGTTLIWQARHSLQIAPPDSVDVFLFPVWAYFSALTAIAVGALVYLLRPSRRELFAIAAGGVVVGMAAGGKWWLEHELGWWHSRFQNTPDPLTVLNPWTWLTFPVFGMLFLLLLSALGRRFGWKVQAGAIALFGLYQEPREHVYFSTFLPALTYRPGLTPILGGAAMLAAGVTAGLLVMRLIAGPDKSGRRPE